MALASWKDLCIDASDASVLGRFWGELLGMQVESKADGDVALWGERPQDTIWVNTVPEPKVAKHRVHLDVSVSSLQAVVDCGAQILAPEGESGGAWTVMADPEGGEFCAFVRADLPPHPAARLFEIVVDTADSDTSRALAQWWAEVFGGRAADDGRGFWWVEALPGAPFEALTVVPVPEPKQGKNRLHWDIRCDDIEALVSRGATVLTPPAEATPWHVMADPQGNEFCVFDTSF